MTAEENALLRTLEARVTQLALEHKALKGRYNALARTVEEKENTIRSLNERIRSRLSEYLSGTGAKFLQEGIVTMRDNRYVLPVRAEYKSRVRGFVHDRSASGATFFIEPEEVLEMNNELRELAAAEKEEIERILAQLSHRVGALAGEIERDAVLLSEIDRAFAKAEYSYKNRCLRPRLNGKGVLDIRKGRHPLLDAKTAVPVSVSFGEKERRMLLVSGPNTGGKTVTMKMCGLFCLMAACGVFLPAAEGTEVSVFAKVFCDVGDSQSIEENLSTFSSHIKTVIGIAEGADANSLVLIDELGSHLHPLITRWIIEQFSRDYNPRHAQLVANSHDISLMDNDDDVLRRDQMWFTNKDSGNGVSDLYSMDDFTGLRREANPLKAYLFGKFEAIPEIASRSVIR